MYKDGHKVDILFLIEHRDRELDAVCAIAKELKQKYGLSVAIASLLFHSLIAAILIRPKVIVVPFGRQESDFPLGLFRAIYGDKVTYVNMNLEQALSPVNRDYKKPRDQFSKLILKHFCWSKTFKKYLTDNGVIENNIYLTGNPATTLLIRMESSQIYLLKYHIAEKFRLPLNCKWCFFPMNCGWAFISDYHIRARIKDGYDEKKAWAYKSYLNKTLNIIFKWIAAAKDEMKNRNIIIILRPHPSVSVQQYKERFQEVVGYVPDYVYILKDLTVKEWLIISDACYTNFSTVALDAKIIGKPTYLMEPEPFPDFLQMDWHKIFSKLSSSNDLFASLKEKSFVSSIKSLPILNNYVDISLDGISESAKYLAQFAKERYFPCWSLFGLLKGVISSLRSSLGSFARLFSVVSGFNPFQVLKPGIRSDFFNKRDVLRLLNN